MPNNFNAADTIWAKSAERRKRGKTMSENQLYSWTPAGGTEQFGTKLAVGSDGLLVMEVKGTGEVRKVAADTVEPVLPYSVSIMFGGEPRMYDYWALPEWELCVGDIVLLRRDGVSIATVCEVDTKSPRATAYLSGIKLAGTPLRRAEPS